MPFPLSTVQSCANSSDRWGYYVSGAGVPKDKLPLISRVIDVEYVGGYCSDAFGIKTPPNVDAINKLGGTNFSYPRVAIIDGKQDPWRAATPHAEGTAARVSTTEQPYILLDPAVHHWDEYGLSQAEKAAGLPPKNIVDVQRQEVNFVKAWVKEWKDQHKGK